MEQPSINPGCPVCGRKAMRVERRSHETVRFRNFSYVEEEFQGKPQRIVHIYEGDGRWHAGHLEADLLCSYCGYRLPINVVRGVADSLSFPNTLPVPLEEQMEMFPLSGEDSELSTDS